MGSVFLFHYMEQNKLALQMAVGFNKGLYQFRAELLSAVKVSCEMFSWLLCVFERDHCLSAMAL